MPWSICCPRWATEFTFEGGAGLLRQLVGFSQWKGIVVEAVSDIKLFFWVDMSIHSTCKVLPPYLQHRCLQSTGYLNTLSFSLSELEGNLYTGGKVDRCKDNAQIKYAALACCQIPQNNHNLFQPVF